MCVRQRLLFDLGADVKKKNGIRYIGIGEMPTRLRWHCYEWASKMSRAGESTSNMENSLTFCELTEKTY